MKDVQQWTMVICLAALTASLAQSILPSGSMERMGKFVVGAFIICVMISPIAKFAPQFRMSINSQNERTASQDTKLLTTVNNQLEQAAQESIQNLVTAELAQIQIKCKNVSVIMDTKEDGRISITKVIVTLSEKDVTKTKTAQDYLAKELGLQMEVVADGS
jgi:stage III sporulation protein AF